MAYLRYGSFHPGGRNLAAIGEVAEVKRHATARNLISVQRQIYA